VSDRTRSEYEYFLETLVGVPSVSGMEAQAISPRRTPPMSIWISIGTTTRL
jgi:hypothetical protein